MRNVGEGKYNLYFDYYSPDNPISDDWIIWVIITIGVIGGVIVVYFKARPKRKTQLIGVGNGFNASF